MGVPKFFRWISERYPLINQTIDIENPGPIFDALYLDMNGIIHNCTHANDEDIVATASRTEEEMILKIFHYLDTLFNIAKPRKLFYMAVDGVAPRAKMNQQRQRRFRSANDAKEALTKLKEKGENPPPHLFDSNCITPGTEFMVRLSEQIKYFIHKKIKEDASWQNVEIIFSGHEVPGEGEHKIMEYIRHAKAQPNWDPNQTHCLYGLDADLIMLSLVSHEPNFALLREEGVLDKRKKSKKGDRAEFHLLHISVLREYLDLEFSVVKESIPFPYDPQRIINDFVLLCFCVGNDFVPGLPGQDIGESSLDEFFSVYKSLLPKLGGYLVEDGHPVLSRFAQFFRIISQREKEKFLQHMDDLKDFGVLPSTADLELAAVKLFGDDKNLSKEEKEDRIWKAMYYKTKFEPNHELNQALVESIRTSFVEALVWIASYYFSGCVSWGWFYPFHYTPLASDLIDISNYKEKITFDLGKPFLPLQQLLGVLPPASGSMLPPSYLLAMTNPSSLIYDYYPEEFKVDMNDKKNAWEGVVLIPFISEEKLLQVTSKLDAQLTEDEKKRNRHGEAYIFRYDKSHKKMETFNCKCWLTGAFPDKFESNARVEVYKLPKIPDNVKTPFRVLPGVNVGENLPTGIPTLKSVKLSTALDFLQLNVFGNPTRKESILVEVIPTYDPEDHKAISDKFLGKSCWLWPYNKEAIVDNVVGPEFDYSLNNDKPFMKKLTGEESRWLTKDAEWIQAKWKNSKAVDVKVDVLVSVRTLIGIQHEKNGSISKKWNSKAEKIPLSLVLEKSPTREDPRFVTELKEPFQQKFSIHSHVISTSKDTYGALCEVLENYGPPAKPMLKVLVKERIFEPKFLKNFISLHSGEKYLSLHQVAKKLQIYPRTLSKITASVKFEPGHHNFGLNIKFSGRNQQVLGYTRRRQLSDNSYGPWEYSESAVNLIQRYKEKYPEVFQILEADLFRDVYSSATLFDPAKITSVDTDLLKKYPFEELKEDPVEDDAPEEANERDKLVTSDNIPNDRGKLVTSTDLVPNEAEDDDVGDEIIFPKMEPGVLRGSGKHHKATDLPKDPEALIKLKIAELKAWLKSLPCSNLPRVVCGSSAFPPDVVNKLEKNINEWVEEEKKILKDLLDKHGSPLIKLVPATFLLTPLNDFSSHANMTEENELESNSYGNFSLGDRVVHLRGFGSTPFGARGTVVAIKGNFVEVLMDKPCIGGLDLEGSCSPMRGLVLSKEVVLNLSGRYTAISSDEGYNKRPMSPRYQYQKDQEKGNESPHSPLARSQDRLTNPVNELRNSGNQRNIRSSGGQPSTFPHMPGNPQMQMLPPYPQVFPPGMVIPAQSFYTVTENQSRHFQNTLPQMFPTQAPETANVSSPRSLNQTQIISSKQQTPPLSQNQTIPSGHERLAKSGGYPRTNKTYVPAQQNTQQSFQQTQPNNPNPQQNNQYLHHNQQHQNPHQHQHQQQSNQHYNQNPQEKQKSKNEDQLQNQHHQQHQYHQQQGQYYQQQGQYYQQQGQYHQNQYHQQQYYQQNYHRGGRRGGRRGARDGRDGRDGRNGRDGKDELTWQQKDMMRNYNM
eukprot:TRINITY_DN4857_c0_g2_i7.p1 TRINITY_DN4857_c0_g2~~TRINITY_DN4857_c0_g2_i7.p1  ORF type:complete len:1567 (-),score=298.85 TRINITY_DN4857_c0_g2_i7:43-4743(-)